MCGEQWIPNLEETKALQSVRSSSPGERPDRQQPPTLAEQFFNKGCQCYCIQFLYGLH